MSRDDIIRLARDAGWPDMILEMLDGTEDLRRLERFAALAAAAVREECAKVCDDKAAMYEQAVNCAAEAAADACAAAIRARSCAG